MVDEHVVAAKLAELAQRIDRIRAKCPAQLDEFAADQDTIDLVSFNLMLCVQACLDVASHIAADEGWRVAKTQAEAFQVLQEHSVISQESAFALLRALGLRNVVAHGYAGVDLAMVHAAATASSADLDRFATEVGRWLTALTEPRA